MKVAMIINKRNSKNKVQNQIKFLLFQSQWWKFLLHSYIGWIRKRMMSVKKFPSFFKNLLVSISFVYTLLEKPKYAKFVKDLETKNKSTSFKAFKASYHYSMIMSSNLVIKKKDTRVFIISCPIEMYPYANSLCDLVQLLI